MIIQINIDKAKEIHKQNIRLARKSKLEELDIKFQREIEKGVNANIDSIVHQKQLLRDAPANSAIDNAKTIEDLVQTWDETLLGPSPY